MGEKRGIGLSERDRIILTDVISAANAVTEKYNITLAIGETVDWKTMKALEPLLGLFLLVKSGNEKAVSHLTGEDGAAVIKAYRPENLDTAYTAEDVNRLKGRIKGTLKDMEAESRIRPRTLYIADCHFYHNRMCSEMDKRGFSGFEEMNEHMILKWNEKVTNKDDVYIIGDFSIAKGDATAKILNRLRGKLHLISGNHDRFLEDKHFDRSLFRSIDEYKEISDNARKVILSHYPVFCYKGQYRRDKDGKPYTYMLYGHVHDTQDEKLVNSFIIQTRSIRALSRHADTPELIPCNMINCFCMFSDYQPMTLDEWIKIDEKRRKRMRDS